MTKLRSSRALPILALIFLLGLAARFAMDHIEGIGPGAHWLVLLLSLPVAVWLTLLYWRRIDEAAREAQKTAWFWGGSVGALLGLAGVVSWASDDPTLGGFLAADASPALLVQSGAIGVLVGQTAGFFIAWAIWWWRMR